MSPQLYSSPFPSLGAAAALTFPGAQFPTWNSNCSAWEGGVSAQRGNPVRLSESGGDRADARPVAGVPVRNSGPGDGDPSAGSSGWLSCACPAVLAVGVELGAHCSVHSWHPVGDPDPPSVPASSAVCSCACAPLLRLLLPCQSILVPPAPCWHSVPDGGVPVWPPAHSWCRGVVWVGRDLVDHPGDSWCPVVL